MSRRTTKSSLKNFLLVTVTVVGVGYFIIDYFPQFKRQDNAQISHDLNEEKIKELARVVAKEVVEDFIRDHPEEIISSVEAMQKKKFEERAQQVSSLIKQNLPALQNKATGAVQGQVNNPKHIIVHFYDYNCGYCKSAADMIKKVAENHKNVLIIFRDLPILGPNSIQLAKIAGGVKKYKPENYAKFYYELFEQADKSADNIKALAVNFGVDKQQLEEYLTSSEAQNYVNLNQEIAKKVQVMGTPFIVVNDHVYHNPLSYDAIKSELK
ncbi:DsbA family protein [Rickettsiales endosymbiont of Stachyamoeba lipophora]|uniref:DsbA family protein n=1 Tax=Rickettsiales endosymbiont of Stachyamoeba lipophora TaxID=2486578 RepID=UPI000F6490E7|nr:thioredoxin domain-containing protein [Rickettsiales endosymbiont of Stachyamoeba lipophora]AZL16169.1 hypothetical protein EF513_06460 [Rickettsiales endosymbiont of Stachyamoeba lipophora]